MTNAVPAEEAPKAVPVEGAPEAVPVNAVPVEEAPEAVPANAVPAEVVDEVVEYHDLWGNEHIPSIVRRPWAVLAEDVEARLTKHAEKCDVKMAYEPSPGEEKVWNLRRQFRDIQTRGARAVFRELPAEVRRIFGHISLCELASYQCWRQGQGDHASEAELEAWERLPAAAKAKLVPSDPLAALAAEPRWAPLLDTVEHKVKQALVIKGQWCDEIFDHAKVWEIRGGPCHIRGRIAIAASGTSTLVGEATVVNCLAVGRRDQGLLVPFGSEREDEEVFIGRPCHFRRHRIRDLDIVKYKEVYAWVLSDPVRYKNPVPFYIPQGAVIWLRLDWQKQPQALLLRKSGDILGYLVISWDIWG